MTKKGYTIKNGFTLIELLLVVSLMAISIGVSGDLLISLVRGFNKSKVINEVEQNANFISQKMNKELRNAKGLVGIAQGEATNTITLRDSMDNQIIYSCQNGVLNRTEGSPGVTLALTSNTGVYGVSVSGTIDGNNCFKLLVENPAVLQIGIQLSQSGSGSGRVFEGIIKIEDVITIRDSYSR